MGLNHCKYKTLLASEIANRLKIHDIFCMKTNFSSDLFTQHPIAWSLVAIILIALAYAMRAIKREKDIFIENGREIKFGPYLLYVPAWWSITKQSENTLRFERTDTRYDWFAYFELQTLAHNKNSIVEEFTSEIHKRQLLFDSDAGIIHEPSTIKQGALENADVARVEGTATENGIERVYYDAMLARDNELQQRIWAESRSSILNGLVEGPYFEYVIQNIKLRQEHRS